VALAVRASRKLADCLWGGVANLHDLVELESKCGVPAIRLTGNRGAQDVVVVAVNVVA